MNERGVDLSKWDKGLKITDVVKAGYKFAILRGGVTGYGILRLKSKDPLFEDYYQEAKRLGVPVGVYYYSCANTRQGGVDEANYLYDKCLKGKQFELPIYIDVENTKWQGDNKKGVTDAILGFCETLKAKGYLAGVYSSPRWFDKKIDTARLNGITKWVAYWSSVSPTVTFSGFDLWQDSDNGSISGHRVDTNIALRDFTAEIKAQGLNGFPKTQPVDEIAHEVIDGKWGKGYERKLKLTEAGYDYDTVQRRVNEILSNPKITIDRIAHEVIDGKWGKGSARKKALTAAGYDYKAVQKRVNELTR